MAKVRNQPSNKKRNEEQVTSTSSRGKSGRPRLRSSSPPPSSSSSNPSPKTPRLSARTRMGASLNSKAKPKTLQNVTNDSGFEVSSSDRPKRATKSSDKRSSAPKIDKKSKTAISKSHKSKKATISNITWLKELLEESKARSAKKKKRLASGIEIRYRGSLDIMKVDGVDYANFPHNNGNAGGYVRMAPGSEKANRRSRTTIHFIILLGRLQLLAENNVTYFKSGSLITIPKGVYYGLRNPTRQTTFLRYQTINADT